MTVPNLVARATRKSVGMLTPARWQLPLEYFLYRHSAGCEAELKWLARICPNRQVAIDIGANIGFYSYAMAQLFEQVFAFEINPQLTRALNDFNCERITVIAKGLSSTARKATLHIPLVNRIALTGWASLTAGNCSDTNEHLEKTVEVITLDSFGLGSVSLIKIDVEGHELEVLRGAQSTVAESRPAVIVEIKEHNRAAVENWFERNGYRQKPLSELAGALGSPENFIFLPQ